MNLKFARHVVVLLACVSMLQFNKTKRIIVKLVVQIV